MCKEVDLNYYTQALIKEDTEVIIEKGINKYRGFSINWGSLKTTQRVIGYEKKRIFDRVRISRHSLSLPEYIFETDGLWIKIESDKKHFIESRGFDFAGTLHIHPVCSHGDRAGN
jgi:DEAD/DEAH box helicase domain-containing protein